jgi:PHP family Zn ribbon phosphoesterase
MGVYNDFDRQFGSELKIMMDIPERDFRKEKFDEKLTEIILANRSGNLKIKPGYDGVYGQIEYVPDYSTKPETAQKTLI